MGAGGKRVEGEMRGGCCLRYRKVSLECRSSFDTSDLPHHNEAANTVISGCASPSCILIKRLNIFHITIKEQGLLLVAPA